MEEVLVEYLLYHLKPGFWNCCVCDIVDEGVWKRFEEYRDRYGARYLLAGRMVRITGTTTEALTPYNFQIF